MKAHITLLIAAILLTGCHQKPKDAIPKEKAAIFFNDVPSDSSGIDFSNTLAHTSDLNIIEYLYYYNGGGVAIGDVNNDGLEDIYLTANQEIDRLYLNLGNLKFKDITESAGLQLDPSWSTGVTMEDVNNDGYIDIYVSKLGDFKTLKSHNLLYINNGDTTFTEASKAYGVDFSGLSTQAAFFDYDKDGDMDMYLMNHSIHTPRSYGKTDLRQVPDPIAGDRLFENKSNENKTEFVDVTEQAGIYSSALGYGLALTIADINDDGWLDIYVGNDFHENDYIYLNQGKAPTTGIVTFKESSADLINHSSRFTMGVDIADLNNDLLPDIFSLDMMPFDAEVFLKSAGEDSDKVNQIKDAFGFNTQYARNTFQLNTGNGHFADIALMTNTYATDWSWSTLIQDYDNDGQNDIFITNGIYKRPNDLDYINYLSNIDFAAYEKEKQNDIEKKLIDAMPTVKTANVMFRNTGDFTFERLTSTAGFTPSYSNGAAYSDLDNDGDLDIVVNNLNAKASLLENQSSTTPNTNYVSFSLQENDNSKNTHGAQVQVYAGEKHWFRELSVVKGFQSTSTRKLHFGLGTAKSLDSVIVTWADGNVQVEKELLVNQHHQLKKNTDRITHKTITQPTPEAYEYFKFSHLENSYIDYEREALMPEKLSTEGPALAKADFNGDGITDIFIGGAKYQSPALYFGTSKGTYIEDKTSQLRKDIIYEDVDATAFDIENDGDMDLYVMSGGNELTEGHPNLEDRIYINNGKGEFERLGIPLIKTNGGSISAADFDGNGYDDLFIGNRSTPGGYGLSPFSYILRNDGTGKFAVQQQERIGMVTDSKWVDVNGDDNLDLIIVGDWMPITVLINQGDATFLNETKTYGLENTNGMWNTIEVADIDYNGEIDLLVGNSGENFKLKASEEYPVYLYIDDFDDNSQPDPLIFYHFFDQYVPFASKDKIMAQLPSLKKKFVNYTRFSKIKNITDLTEKKEADILEIKTIKELRSMVYMNIGANTKPIALPKQAQMSSIEDFELLDNGNVAYVGNHLGYTTELGRSTENSGGILQVSTTGEITAGDLLGLPKATNARQITPIGNNNYLVLVNDDRSLVIRINNN